MSHTRRLRLRRFARDTRGATVVEYSLILALVVAGAAPFVGSLGKRVASAFEASIAIFDP